jgi:tRNA threonylcarbamoyl adenosine modification protein YjeE
MMPWTPSEAVLCLTGADRTADLGRWIAPQLDAGDVLLLDGPLGAGKSHLARAIIQTRVVAEGRHEDVPSPTFTLVQFYDCAIPMVHADLYRLADPDEASELGLTDGFGTSITLIEWPARLGAYIPTGALTVRMAPDGSGDTRILQLSSTSARWAALIAGAARDFGP